MSCSAMEATMIHHVIIVLFLLWVMSYLNRSHAALYFVALIYLYLVNERYVMRLKRKLQFEERKQANQRRVLSESESVRWLNHAIEKIWLICMEPIASQKILLPIIPWFLEKYRPWTAKKAVVQHLYLGRNPPLLTDIRVVRQSTGDDHLVFELGMNFLTADDMSAILAVKLRKRLGFGMWAKLHLTGMHVEGKVLVGVKFLRRWPFLGRLRVCFAEPPYFQMTVKPIFTHGLDVAVLPGIAGWLDKLLSIAFEQTLVEPNMLVVNVEKFASPGSENWFFVDEKDPVAHALVEVIEASDMKPSDLNGLSDPFVKGQLGPYRFKTKVMKKTLSPKWQEEFKIPICTWESPNNILNIEVRDKDRFGEDALGDCTVNISELRGGQRRDMWLSLQNIKMGRLHLAITVFEENQEMNDNQCDEEKINYEDLQKPVANGNDSASYEGLNSRMASEKSPRVTDSFEPINIDGQRETGIWVHQPGSEVSQIWEPRKGKTRRLDNQIQRVPNDSFGSNRSSALSPKTESSSTDENQETKNPIKLLGLGLRKMGIGLDKKARKEEKNLSVEDDFRSPRVNLKALNDKAIGRKLVVEDNLSGPLSGGFSTEGSMNSEGSSLENPQKGHMKGMARSILRQAEKSAKHIKHKLSRNSRGDAAMVVGQDIILETESDCDSDTESDSLDGKSQLSGGTKEISAVVDPARLHPRSPRPEGTMNNVGDSKRKEIEDVEKTDKNEKDSSDRVDKTTVEATETESSESGI